MVNKRGQGISINMVVVAIIAVLVLVVLAIVFTGGVGNAVQNMRNFFKIGTEGQTLEYVKEQCRVLCDQAKIANNPGQSSFCTRVFTVTENNAEKEYSCTGNMPGTSNTFVTCPGVPCG